MAMACVAREGPMPESAGALLKRIRFGDDRDLLSSHVLFAGGGVRHPSQQSMADELAALANGRGGELVLGVDGTTGEILGIPVERLDDVVGLVGEVCWDTVEPPVYAMVERMELPDASGTLRCVVRVSVERSLFVHQSPGGYLRRMGGYTAQLSPNALARLFQERSQAGLSWYDESIVGGTALDDLDHDLVDRFRTRRTEDAREVLAEKLGLAGRSNDGSLKPTLAGVLLAFEHPERWLPNAFIQAVAYRGTSVSDALSAATYQIDTLDCLGPLDRQVADACRFVAKNQSVFAGKSIGRADHPQYDMAAVFEAVVNAVAHRDYSAHGSKIRLRLFSDRLELYSPGGPPNGITLDALAYRQASRNNTVASLLATCPVPEGVPGLQTTRATLMGRRGEGVGVILRRSEEHSGRLPVYELFDESELRLTIFAAAPQEG